MRMDLSPWPVPERPRQHARANTPPM